METRGHRAECAQQSLQSLAWAILRFASGSPQPQYRMPGKENAHDCSAISRNHWALGQGNKPLQFPNKKQVASWECS